MSTRRPFNIGSAAARFIAVLLCAAHAAAPRAELAGRLRELGFVSLENGAPFIKAL